NRDASVDGRQNELLGALAGGLEKSRARSRRGHETCRDAAMTFPDAGRRSRTPPRDLAYIDRYDVRRAPHRRSRWRTEAKVVSAASVGGYTRCNFRTGACVDWTRRCRARRRQARPPPSLTWPGRSPVYRFIALRSAVA